MRPSGCRSRVAATVATNPMFHREIVDDARSMSRPRRRWIRVAITLANLIWRIRDSRAARRERAQLASSFPPRKEVFVKLHEFNCRCHGFFLAV